MTSQTDWAPTGRKNTGHDPPRYEWERGGERVWTDDPDGPSSCEGESLGQSGGQAMREDRVTDADVEALTGHVLQFAWTDAAGQQRIDRHPLTEWQARDLLCRVLGVGCLGPTVGAEAEQTPRGQA